MVKLYAKLRSILGIPVFIIGTVILSITMIIVGYLKLKKFQDLVGKYWGLMFCYLFGVRFEVNGTDKLPKDRGVLFLFNHQSLADIPVMWSAVPKSFRFGAKIELFKIPFFGPAMAACGVLPIARDNRKAVFQVYKDAEKRFAKGDSFALAPEGTRQKEPEIGPFKKGPFIFAHNAKAPLVPIVLKGAHEVLEKHSLMINSDRFRRVVKIQFLDPIEPDFIDMENLNDSVDQVRERYVKAYSEL